MLYYNMIVLSLDSFYYSEITLSCLIIKESQISVGWGRQRINRWWCWFLFHGPPIHASFLCDVVPDSVDFSISNVVPKYQVKTCSQTCILLLSHPSCSPGRYL